MSEHCGSASTVVLDERCARIALVGSPNAGKTTLFNALTGLRAKVGNYPGVTVAKFEGMTSIPGGEVIIEDLPGTYSLDPISPDEQVVADALDSSRDAIHTPDGVLVVVDATTLRRSLGLVAHVLHMGLPTCVVLTFVDDLTRRSGAVDAAALEAALGVPVITVSGGNRDEVTTLRELLAGPASWQRPVLLPPTEPDELSGWCDSVAARARWHVPQRDRRSERIDAVLLHPLWGTLIFFATMFIFFQVIFTFAAPLQDQVDAFFGWLGDLVQQHVHNDVLARFLGQAVIGGVGSVLVFVPQIALLFLLISILEGSGYLSRAAFLMDRLMAKAGLEGRAFVALLSSLACAIPGIMATRSLPSAKDRLATMMSAPLMTCSARLPVYVLLIGLLVDPHAKAGPFGAQGAVMFALYLMGAVAAMTTAWLFKRITGRRGPTMPFYMEMPTYKVPRLRSVTLSVWEACKSFMQKVGRVILAVSIVLWVLLNLPTHSDAEMRLHGVNPANSTAVSAYTLDHSVAAKVGKAVEPVFDPLGFDWRVNIGVLASTSAREVFVATLGQVAAADNPDDPHAALAHMTRTDGADKGAKLFDAPTTAALLVYFLFALQCMSTIGVMHRETGTWKWPAIAFGYMFALAWVAGVLTHIVVAALT